MLLRLGLTTRSASSGEVRPARAAAGGTTLTSGPWTSAGPSTWAARSTWRSASRWPNTWPQNGPDGFVADLVRHAPAIVFSAATPLQGGIHHVNEQWPDYWIRRFEQHGFTCWDVFRPSIRYDRSVAWIYRQNLMLVLGSRTSGTRGCPRGPAPDRARRRRRQLRVRGPVPAGSGGRPGRNRATATPARRARQSATVCAARRAVWRDLSARTTVCPVRRSSARSWARIVTVVVRWAKVSGAAGAARGDFG